MGASPSAYHSFVAAEGFYFTHQIKEDLGLSPVSRWIHTAASQWFNLLFIKYPTQHSQLEFFFLNSVFEKTFPPVISWNTLPLSSRWITLCLIKSTIPSCLICKHKPVSFITILTWQSKKKKGKGIFFSTLTFCLFLWYFPFRLLWLVKECSYSSFSCKVKYYLIIRDIQYPTLLGCQLDMPAPPLPFSPLSLLSSPHPQSVWPSTVTCC